MTERLRLLAQRALLGVPMDEDGCRRGPLHSQTGGFTSERPGRISAIN